MLSRRRLLTLVPAAAALPFLGKPAQALGYTDPSAAEQPTLTVAHLTDIHFGAELLDPRMPAGLSERGLRATLQQAQSQGAGLILQGGDLLAEAFNLPLEQVQPQLDGVLRVLREEVKVPIRHAVGNHDIWGWDKEKSRTAGNEPGWGKGLYMQALGMDRPYYSFDQAGWHFAVLDDIQPDKDGYTVKLDSDQFKWLADDLSAHSALPTVILSHAPILSVGAFFDGSFTTGNWVVPHSVMHIDAQRLKNLFKKHPQVKLALSGHTHLRDQALYGALYANGGPSQAPPGKATARKLHQVTILFDFMPVDG
ncbi:metallophosphoesterase family protein [Deinococcus lacus]|uniref:Metallophosphoesterase family protein n=1 Tax=Deinococcus lacus TaxID=392561 RepID=A0ABW1YCM0_9DEIO